MFIPYIKFEVCFTKKKKKMFEVWTHEPFCGQKGLDVTCFSYGRFSTNALYVWNIFQPFNVCPKLNENMSQLVT